MSFLIDHIERHMRAAAPQDVVKAAREGAVDWFVRAGYITREQGDFIPHEDVALFPEDLPWMRER